MLKILDIEKQYNKDSPKGFIQECEQFFVNETPKTYFCWQILTKIDILHPDEDITHTYGATHRVGRMP